MEEERLEWDNFIKAIHSYPYAWDATKDIAVLQFSPGTYPMLHRCVSIIKWVSRTGLATIYSFSKD